MKFTIFYVGSRQVQPRDDLVTTLQETLRALATRATHKGLELVYRIDPIVPDALVGDATRLRQVLIGVVGNAIQLTERGEVVVDVGLGPSTDDVVWLRIAIRNTGIGTSPDKQDTIFRVFAQEATSIMRKHRGLDLTIWRLIELVHGERRLESELGSMFELTARFEEDPDSVPSPPPPTERPALVAGDNVEGGLRSPRKLLVLAARVTDCIVLVIRRDADLAAARIVWITPSAGPSDVVQHIDASILRPALADDLLDTLLAITQASSGVASPALLAPPTAALPLGHVALRVLVAEDNPFNSELLFQLLTRRGHDVRIARTGRETLDLVEVEPCDLLLLDVHMPELDGFDVIAAIRERERETGTYLPVIAVTARARVQDRERCLAAGMDEHLTKPISAAALWSGIDRVMPRARSGRDPPR